ncbi:MAG TPA: hypothetical protein VMN60_05490 [Longimicrobiales bacterium]|nr:hypothetical protein [Longimicrobiales bacterium]
MMRLASVPAALLLLIPAAYGAAQQRVCNLNSRPGGVLNTPAPNFTTATLPVITCEGGLTITANTANYTPGRIDLFGDVNVRDAERTLTADQAVFFNARRELQATGRAVLTEHATGSVIRGGLVNLQEETAQRESRIEAVATTDDAQAVLIRDSESRPGQRDTMTIDAQHIIIMGERSFRAVGNAVMRRDSLTARGFTIEYAQAAGALEVAGAARVMLPRYTLIGDSVSAKTGTDDDIESVLSRHGAQLQSEEMNVRANAVRIFFVAGGLERMVAMDWPPVQNVAAGPRPRVEATEFNLESDSIDVLAPGQVMTEAVAIGNAYGERITPDSMKALIPETRPEIQALIANDWMRGDTVRAFFAANPAAAADPNAADRIMERLLASGGPARSMYRMRDAQNPALELSINYLVAEAIEVTFENGAATLLRASGDAKGVYLQPEEAARRARVGGDANTPVRRP